MFGSKINPVVNYIKTNPSQVAKLALLGLVVSGGASAGAIDVVPEVESQLDALTDQISEVFKLVFPIIMTVLGLTVLVKLVKKFVSMM